PPRFDQEPAHVALFFPGAEPRSGRWERVAIADAPVLHAIDVLDLDGDGASEVLGASNRGVTETAVGVAVPGPQSVTNVLVPGAPGDAPKKGCSEVHVGRLKGGRRLLTTVEPWHG